MMIYQYEKFSNSQIHEIYMLWHDLFNPNQAL